jgi:transcription initiation factor IIE alpha subunit
MHKRNFRTSCKQCVEQNARQSEAIAYTRQKIYDNAAKDRSKHQNETCSNCDRPLDFDEWFCYCSLCPDCYLQTPESEIEELDKRIKELTGSKKPL